MKKLSYDTKLVIILGIVIGVLFALISTLYNYVHSYPFDNTVFWFAPVNSIIMVVFGLIISNGINNENKNNTEK